MAQTKYDLSEEHKPVGDFLDLSNLLEKSKVQTELTQAQIDYFHTYGYVTNIPVLTAQQVDILLQELSLISDPKHAKHNLFYEFHSNETGDSNNVLFHALGAWRISESFHDIIFHPALSKMASQLIENNIRLWHDQLFCKPPEYGSCVAWHQDYSYWTRVGDSPKSFLTCHIALDEQTVDNGCLHYIPGSHKWPLLPITSRHFNDMDSIKTILTNEQKLAFQPVPMLLKKGEACFHHALTVHGSFGNHSKVPRRATVINYLADGIKSNTNDVLLDGIPVIPCGQKMEGQFFPLLYQSSQ